MANIKNLAAGTVLTGPGTSGTTMVLDTGYGNTMPAVPFYLTCSPQGQLSTFANSEIVLVTARTGDTLTITRAQKDTTAKNIAAGWVVANGVYAEDIFGSTSFVTHETPTGAVNGTNNSFTTASAYLPGTLQYYVNGIRQSLGAGHFTETSPTTGVFTTSEAPLTGSVIGVSYQKAVSTTGNADKVDGYDVNPSPTPGTILPLDSSGLLPASVIGGAWDSWTPSYTNLTVGNGTVVALYKQYGKTVHFYFKITLGSTTAIGTQPRISPPVAPSTVYNLGIAERFMRGHIEDNATASYVSAGGFFTNGDILVQVLNAAGTYVNYSSISATVPMTWAAGDTLSLTGTYQAA